MKKVLFLSPTPPPAGGIASWTLRMLEHPLPKGWGIVHVDTKLIGGAKVFSGKRKLYTEIFRHIQITKNLYKSLKTNNVLIVHSSTPGSKLGLLRELLFIIISKSFRKKYIVHYRCTLPNVISDYFHCILLKIVGILSDGAIVLNKKSYKYYIDNAGSRCNLIPNFTDVPEKLDAKCVDSSDEIRKILYVGGVTPQKGCLAILEAAHRFPNFEFHLVGDVGDAIKSIEVESNVYLHGEMEKEDVYKKYQESDVFLFIGNFSHEGFSNSLVEAMSFGLPCIVSDWAANADMIEDKGGIVIPPCSKDDLTSSLIKLSLDLKFYNDASQWNVKKVNYSYSRPVVVNQYIEFYESAIAR